MGSSIVEEISSSIVVIREIKGTKRTMFKGYLYNVLFLL
jgi:hypothetical protein